MADPRPSKDVMPNGTFYFLFGILLLGSAFLFTGFVCILRQGFLQITPGNPDLGPSGKSYVVAPDRFPQEYWRSVVGIGVAAAILLILDLWMLVRHLRAKRRAE